MHVERVPKAMGFDSSGKCCKVPGYRSKNEAVQISNQLQLVLYCCMIFFILSNFCLLFVIFFVIGDNAKSSCGNAFKIQKPLFPQMKNDKT